ncbi:unnamed protein product [Periconia digitata]|uniref:Ubiquitin-like domain-containing protein n=1 Tax=Periconia digitata TaxID=1303443 RepID=A0A9W4UTJ9_9PLEO|nr:unnamed protein product [Periconia digitata]
MMDGDAGATAAPPPKKKKFTFNRAKWQTQAPKAEDEPEVDIFSHSNDFEDIIAEEARQKLEAKKKAEAARKRKADELRSRAKRKASEEAEGHVARKASGGSSQCQTGSNLRSPAPQSPVRSKSPLDTLATRYESFTRSSNISSSKSSQQQSNTITLDDSDGEDSSQVYSQRPFSPTRSTMPIHTVPSASPSDIEEGEDPALVELRSKARARAAERAARASKTSETPEKQDEQAQSPAVQLLMTSEIPNTVPLIVKVRLNTTLERPRTAWCQRQGFTPAQSRDVFITFKMREIYDTTKIERLDLTHVGNGTVRMKGDETYYDETNLARPQVQLWTRELFEEYKKREAEEAAAGKACEQLSSLEQPEPEPEPEQVPQIHLHLRAKNKTIWKIIVKPDTTISHLMDGYKQSRDIPAEQPITLMIDDERLKPMDVISDYEIEDNDTIDVYLK